MLVSQMAGVGMQECWSVEMNVGRSNGWVGREVCCSGQTAEVGMQVPGMLIG